VEEVFGKNLSADRPGVCGKPLSGGTAKSQVLWGKLIGIGACRFSAAIFPVGLGFRELGFKVFSPGLREWWKSSPCGRYGKRELLRVTIWPRPSG